MDKTLLLKVIGAMTRIQTAGFVRIIIFYWNQSLKDCNHLGIFYVRPSILRVTYSFTGNHRIKRSKRLLTYIGSRDSHLDLNRFNIKQMVKSCS